MNQRPPNNGLHQTGRGGVAFAFRRRPVVEARPAGEAKCCTHVAGPTFTAARASKTTSLIPVGTIMVAAALPRRGFYGGMAAVAPESRGGGKGSRWSGWKGQQRAWLGRGLPSSGLGTSGPTGLVYNNGMHLTKVDVSRCTPFAGDPECWAGRCGLQRSDR